MKEPLPNVFDMLQHGLTHFRTHVAGGLREALPLLLALSVLYAAVNVTIVRDANLNNATAAFADRVDIGALLTLLIMGVLAVLLSIA